MAYLLDTNTCIATMRGVPSVVAAMASRNPSDLVVSSVTTYELFTGIEKCAYPKREQSKVETLLDTLERIDFDREAAQAAARIRAQLELRGEMIGPYDVLLAGQALSRGLTLVTANTGEFCRVPALKIEDWQSTASSP